MAPLWKLCMDGDLGGVSRALRRGERVNSGDSIGNTGLMWAVSNKHNSIVEFLLQYPGVDVNCQNTGGSTALHDSVYSDNLEGLRLLLAHPGMRSLNTKAGGWTPLMRAVYAGHLSCVIELVRVEGVDLDTRDGQGRSLEEVARAGSNTEIERLIHEARQQAIGPGLGRSQKYMAR